MDSCEAKPCREKDIAVALKRLSAATSSILRAVGEIQVRILPLTRTDDLAPDAPDTAYPADACPLAVEIEHEAGSVEMAKGLLVRILGDLEI